MRVEGWKEDFSRFIVKPKLWSRIFCSGCVCLKLSRRWTNVQTIIYIMGTVYALTSQLRENWLHGLGEIKGATLNPKHRH